MISYCMALPLFLLAVVYIAPTFHAVAPTEINVSLIDLAKKTAAPESVLVELPSSGFSQSSATLPEIYLGCWGYTREALAKFIKDSPLISVPPKSGSGCSVAGDLGLLTDSQIPQAIIELFAYLPREQRDEAAIICDNSQGICTVTFETCEDYEEVLLHLFGRRTRLGSYRIKRSQLESIPEIQRLVLNNICKA